MQHVDEVLGRDVAGRPRRERTAADASDRRVEHGRARLDCGIGVREAGVAGVVQVDADREPESGDGLDEPADPARRSDADRVREDDLVRAGGGDLLGEAHDVLRLDRPLEGAAERDTDRHAGADPVLVRPRDDAPGGLDRRCDRGTLVSLVHRLRRCEGEVRLLEPGRGQAVVAALVENEAGVDDARPALYRRDHLLGPRHLRDTRGVDEAHRLDSRQPGGGEQVDELRPDARLEHDLVVLEPVARRHVAHGDAAHTTPSSFSASSSSNRSAWASAVRASASRRRNVTIALNPDA